MIVMMQYIFIVKDEKKKKILFLAYSMKGIKHLKKKKKDPFIFISILLFLSYLFNCFIG